MDKERRYKHGTPPPAIISLVFSNRARSGTENVVCGVWFEREKILLEDPQPGLKGL